MSEDHSLTSLEARRRKLDELFADQPFLSSTMKASRMHERLDDSPAPLHIPVLSPVADDEMLRRMEAARRSTPPGSCGAEIPVTIENPRLPEGWHSTHPAPSEQPAGRPIRFEVPRIGAQSDEPANVVRLDLVLDTSVSPAHVRPASRGNERPVDVMTLPEAAEYLRLSPSTLRKLMQKDRLPAVRIGRKLRFRRAAILEWLAQREA